MKLTTTLVALLLCASFAFTQGPVVFEVSRLLWDHDDCQDGPPPSCNILEEFRVYCNDISGVLPSPDNLVGTIITPEREWLITLSPGHNYCMVTAAIPSQTLESGPSNELEFTVERFVPQNLRIGDVISTDGQWILRGL